jgi:hypothetical protein
MLQEMSDLELPVQPDDDLDSLRSGFALGGPLVEEAATLGFVSQYWESLGRSAGESLFEERVSPRYSRRKKLDFVTIRPRPKKAMVPTASWPQDGMTRIPAST